MSKIWHGPHRNQFTSSQSPNSTWDTFRQEQLLFSWNSHWTEQPVICWATLSSWSSLPPHTGHFLLKTDVSFRSFSLPRYITVTTQVFTIHVPGHSNFADHPLKRVYFPTPWLWLQPCYLLWPREQGRHDSVPFPSLSTEKPCGCFSCPLAPQHHYMTRRRLPEGGCSYPLWAQARPVDSQPITRLMSKINAYWWGYFSVACYTALLLPQ